MTKILLVEDDKSLREIYGVRLLAEGYDIVTAGDGEEALAMAIKERPDLILSDVMMPKISGFDMLDILRSTTETRGIKVIMMTALSSEDQRARGEALGADRYLVKSQVGIEDVVRTVHEVLGDAPLAATGAAANPFTATAFQPTGSTPQQHQPQPQPQPAQPQYQPQPAAPTYGNNPAQQPEYQQPQQQFAPQQQPQQQPQPPHQPAAEAPQPSALPRPTAPFSTPRPANLGDRIIHPITQQERAPDMGNLIDQELGRGEQTPDFAAFTAPQPQVQPDAEPAHQEAHQQPPQPQQFEQPQQPQAQSQPVEQQPQPQPLEQPQPVEQPQQPQYEQQPIVQPQRPFGVAPEAPQSPYGPLPSQPAQQHQQLPPAPAAPEQTHGAVDISFEETPRQQPESQPYQPPAA